MDRLAGNGLDKLDSLFFLFFSFFWLMTLQFVTHMNTHGKVWNHSNMFNIEILLKAAFHKKHLVIKHVFLCCMMTSIIYIWCLLYLTAVQKVGKIEEKCKVEKLCPNFFTARVMICLNIPETHYGSVVFPVLFTYLKRSTLVKGKKRKWCRPPWEGWNIQANGSALNLVGESHREVMEVWFFFFFYWSVVSCWETQLSRSFIEEDL